MVCLYQVDASRVKKKIKAWKFSREFDGHFLKIRNLRACCSVTDQIKGIINTFFLNLGIYSVNRNRPEITAKTAATMM